MRHTCEFCETRYDIDDVKVAGKFLKVRCRVCNGSMHVVGVDMRAAGTWWVCIGGTAMGPYFQDAVKELVKVGDVHAKTKMWTKGMPGWSRVCESDALAWVYAAIVEHTATDELKSLPLDDVLARAALVTDGSGYFPDPTLHSGVIVLDEKTQADLRALYERGQKRERRRAPTGTHAQPPRSLGPALAAAAVSATAAAAGIVWMVAQSLA
jgi:predicted Zn finger-like uncharacterized protein